MAKIEEVAELLTEEIKNFKKTVKQIEDLSKNIDNSSIKNDIAFLKGVVQTHNEHQLVMNTNSNKAIRELVTEILNQLKFPKIIIQVAVFVLLFFLIVITYSFYRINNVNEIEIRAYEQGKSESINHYTNFVKDNPEVDNIYREWVGKGSIE